MKGYFGSSGLWAFLLFLWDQRKKKRKKHLPPIPDDYSYLDIIESDHAAEMEKNIRNVSKIVDQYKDYSAEVISISIFGRKKVETFRLVHPGDIVDLRYIDDEIKVYSFERFIADLIPDPNSHLREVMSNDIPYHAYLGGRKISLTNLDDYDSCSIIVFYKLDGVPPTKVILK